MNKIVKVILVITLVSGMLITGCSGKSNQEGPEVGKQAPDFQLSTLDGQTVALSELGGTPVLVNFWQIRCPPCREEMPYLQQIYDEWQERGLVVLGINIGESPSHVADFMQSQELSLPVLLDTNQEVARGYYIQYIPSTFFIDKNGIIQDMKVGAFQSKAEIESSLNKLAITK